MVFRLFASIPLGSPLPPQGCLQADQLLQGTQKCYWVGLSRHLQRGNKTKSSTKEVSWNNLSAQGLDSFKVFYCILCQTNCEEMQ